MDDKELKAVTIFMAIVVGVLIILGVVVTSIDVIEQDQQAQVELSR